MAFKNAVAQKAWRLNHPERAKELQLRYRTKHRDRVKLATANRTIKVKTAVLTHYGKDGKLQCCWPGCEVTDLDMLTADHVNNDGAEARRKNPKDFGRALYKRLIKEGYPAGFQTLCANHQLKKDIVKRRLASGITVL